MSFGIGEPAICCEFCTGRMVKSAPVHPPIQAKKLSAQAPPGVLHELQDK
jgi:hypothetical protein